MILHVFCRVQLIAENQIPHLDNTAQQRHVGHCQCYESTKTKINRCAELHRKSFPSQ